MNFLSKDEVQLMHSLAFSLSEEVDIFYAYHSTKECFTSDTMRDKMIYAIEILENMREGTPSYSKALLTLYILSMGKYDFDNQDLTVF